MPTIAEVSFEKLEIPPFVDVPVSGNIIAQPGNKYLSDGAYVISLPDPEGLEIGSMIGIVQTITDSTIRDTVSIYFDEIFEHTYTVYADKEVFLILSKDFGNPRWVVIKNWLSATDQLNYVQGVPGPEGPEGPEGPQGIQGPQGVPGPEGPRGVQGFPGNDGEDGEEGPQGPIGPEGPDGPEGPQGVPGPEGPEGPPGPQGIQGIKGDKGDNGDRGFTGKNAKYTERFFFPGFLITLTDAYKDLHGITYRHHGPTVDVSNVIFIIGAADTGTPQPLVDVLVNNTSILQAPVRTNGVHDTELDAPIIPGSVLAEGDLVTIPVIQGANANAADLNVLLVMQVQA